MVQTEVDVRFDDGDLLEIGLLEVGVLDTPGHTPDSIGLLLNRRTLLTGDTMFAGKMPGQNDHTHRRPRRFLDAIQRTMKLTHSVQVWPGHDVGTTAAEPGSRRAAGDFQENSAYVPGQFYRRELPCITAVLAELGQPPDVVVIDGFVWLDPSGSKGLGGYLYEELSESTPVIGVAKTGFATATNAKELFRGASNRPLYITAAGIAPCDAVDCIRRMHGPNRIPTLLKSVDRLSRFA